MPCTCNIKVKTKFISKLKCSSSKQTDNKETHKLSQTSRDEKQQIDYCVNSKKDKITSQDKEKRRKQGVSTITLATTKVITKPTESLEDEQFDGLTELKSSESKNELSSQQPRRRKSTVDRLRDFFTASKTRRDAICDEMEKNVENSGLNLRQYRKFLATTSVLQELKML